jgi:hypothetical protein
LVPPRSPCPKVGAGAPGSARPADELFWGVDSLPLLDRYLAGERLDPGRLARWRAVTPSATRRR